MQIIQKLEIYENSREEILPGFAPAFPYIATLCELDNYIEPFVPWHWHRTVELFYMESGCLEYTTPHGKWIFPAGSGGFVNSNVLHTTRTLSSQDSNIQLLHLFDLALLSGEHGSRMESKYILPLTSAAGVEMIPLYPEDPRQEALLKQIRGAFEIPEGQWGYEFRLREALTRIWLELLDLARPAMESGRETGDANEKIKDMMVYVHEHFGEPISVDQLAEAAHVSRRVCFRLFRENLHMSPVEYIRSFRLREACQRLAKSGDPITQIAYDCGLGSASYFGKVFREQFGCSPAQYRQKWHDRDNS